MAQCRVLSSLWPIPHLTCCVRHLAARLAAGKVRNACDSSAVFAEVLYAQRTATVERRYIMTEFRSGGNRSAVVGSSEGF